MSTPKAQKETFLLYRIRVHKDRSAFGELHDQYAPGVFRFLRAKLPSKEDAEDILSLTFLRAWNYLVSTHVESASGLVFTIARAGIAEFYRRKRPSTEPLDTEEGVQEHLASDDGADMRRTEAKTELALVKEVLAEFTEDERLAFSLRFLDGLSVAEVAERIEKTENATHVLLHRLKKRIQKRFP